jgi:predicted nuclease with RNAse H fold
MMPSTPVFVGIDVACAKRKRLPICFAAYEGSRLEPLLIPLELAEKFPVGRGNVEIAQDAPFRREAAALTDALNHVCMAQGWSIMRIAIDAPAAPPATGIRASEQALRDSGLSSFQTPNVEGWNRLRQDCRKHLRVEGPLNRLPHANKIWMLYGFEIFKALRAGCTGEVIEVYPYAIVHALLRECPHKSTPEGYRRQVETLANETGWNWNDLEYALGRAVPGTKHDKLDAFMAAWIASLAPQSRRAYGNEKNPDDAIWVPRN